MNYGMDSDEILKFHNLLPSKTLNSNRNIKQEFINSEGYILYVSIKTLKQFMFKNKIYNVNMFHTANPNTLGNIRLFISKHQLQISLLSSRYEGSDKKMLFKCLVDGYEWETIWDVIKRFGGCPKCGGLMSPSFEEKKSEIESIKLNIEVLEDCGDNYMLKCRCKIDNNIFSASYHNLKNRNIGGCPVCGHKSRLEKITRTIDEFVHSANIIHNSKYDYSTSIYVDSKTKVSIICPFHGTFQQRPYAHLIGQGCPECMDRRHFNVSVADLNKDDFESIKSKLYIVQCVNGQEKFYKIGLTTRTIKKRFNSKTTMPYDYIIIKEIDCNLYEAIYLEYKLHRLFRQYKYRPKVSFGGETECFSQLDFEKVNNILCNFKNMEELYVR